MGTQTTTTRKPNANTPDRPADFDTLACDLADLFADRGAAYRLPVIADDVILKALPVFFTAMGFDSYGRPGETTTGHDEQCATQGLFGRYDVEGCNRCRELDLGAPARPRPRWVDALYAARYAGQDAYAAEIKGHFGRGGRHADCGTTCTFTFND